MRIFFQAFLGLSFTLAGCGGPVTPAADGGATDAGDAQVVHGCTAFDDQTASGAARRVSFGSANGSPPLGYAPKCLAISAGQSVTFTGNFSVHPLVPGEYQGDAGAANNPITRTDMGSADTTFQFPAPGLYPYYCDYHAPTMVGVVQVR